MNNIETLLATSYSYSSRLTRYMEDLELAREHT